MPIPALLGGLGRMGLGIATSTLGGLGMGIGYGFGVRLGYNAYKPNQDKNINKQVLALNPIEAGNGMGRDIASRQFGATDQPSITYQARNLVTNDTTTQRELIPNVDASAHITREQKNKMTREEYKRWFHKTSYTSRRTSR